MDTFIMAKRNQKADELDTDMPASHLLKIIASRARRTNEFNAHNLKIGEAFLGDFRNYGMSEQQYRTAKEKLNRWGFASFRATNKGTIATLLNDDIYDINLKQSNRPATGQQQASNRPATTNNKDNNVNNDNKKEYSPNSDEFRLSLLLLNLILERKPDYKKPDLQKWAVEIGRMIRIDRRKPDKIEQVIRFAQADTGNGNWNGWQNNILSTSKLRGKFDKLELAIGKKDPYKPKYYTVPENERKAFEKASKEML